MTLHRDSKLTFKPYGNVLINFDSRKCRRQKKNIYFVEKKSSSYFFRFCAFIDKFRIVVL